MKIITEDVLNKLPRFSAFYDTYYYPDDKEFNDMPSSLYVNLEDLKNAMIENDNT